MGIDGIHYIDHGPYHNDFDKVLKLLHNFDESVIDKRSYGIEIKNALEIFDTIIIFKRDSIDDFNKSLKELEIKKILSLDINNKVPEKIIRNVKIKFNLEYFSPSSDLYKDFEEIAMFKFDDYENVRSFLVFLSKTIPTFTFLALSRLKNNRCRCLHNK